MILDVKLHLGQGEETKTEYYGQSTVFLHKTNVSGAGRFSLLINTKNIETGYLDSVTSPTFSYYGFDSGRVGFYRFARIAIVDNNDKLVGINLWYIETFTAENGEVVWGVVDSNIIGAGRTSYNGDWVMCTTNNSERIVWNDEFDKVTDDDTPNTKPDGGFGSGKNPTDTIDIPPLPDINLNATGSSLYALSESQMLQFTAWLWTSDWVDNIKKLRTDPMQNIVGVSITDIPVSGTDATIVVGNIDSAKSAKLIGRWAEINCGTITADEFYGTFADYEPYIHYTLYLPKVGFVSIPADVVTNNNITIVYHIEMSSGEGICYVLLQNTRNGFSYIYNTYSCQCCSNVALSASDHTAQIQASIQAGTSLVTSAIKGDALGIANSAMSGAVNVATAKNPTTTRGAMGNMSSLMSYKKPYILIDATYLTKPSGFKANNGHAIYFTTTLSALTGYVQTQEFHAKFEAPQKVLDEIEMLLNGGVFIDE